MATLPPRIALLAAPELAAPLTQLGFHVTSATTTADLAEVAAEIARDGFFRVVAAASQRHGPEVAATVAAAVERQQQQAAVAVVVLQPAGVEWGFVTGGVAAEVPDPVTVNAVLAGMGYASAPSGGDAVVSLAREGIVAAAPQPAPMALPGIAPVAPVVPQIPEPVAPAVPQPPAHVAPVAPVAPVVPQIPEPVAPAVPHAPYTPAPVAPAIPHAPVHVEPPAQVAPAAPHAPYAPAPAVPQPPAGHGDSLLDDFFTRNEHRTPTHTHTTANVVIVFAAKGGVSKTTTTFALAKTAAAANLRVLVIDGNRGQSGISSLLRLPEHAPLPTVHDAGSPGVMPLDVVCTPQQLQQYRQRLEPVGFSVVLAPPPAHATPAATPASLYGDIIDAARHEFDLIVIDTQVFDAEVGELFRGAWIPELLDGAWGVALTDPSTESTEKLVLALDRLRDRGVSNARILAVAALWEPDEFDNATEQALSRGLSGLAKLVGTSVRDTNIATELTVGHVDTSSPAIRPVTRALLSIITGNPEFDDDTTSKRTRKWRRKWGRR